MLLGNLIEIITDNYQSALSATGKEGVNGKFRVFLIFWLGPVVFGSAIGILSPIWNGLLQVLLTILGVLTGFSINAIVLLMRHSPDESYELETSVVEKTRHFTLYSILVGLVLIITTLFGFAFSNSSFVLGPTSHLLISIILYTLVSHYFATMLIITHRFHTLINGDAIGN